MKKIKLYETYLFDPENRLNIRENGTYTVQVIAKEHRLFRKPLYIVISVQTGAKIRCIGDVLFPIPNGSTPIITRCPDDFPPINKEDLLIIEKLLNDIDPSDPIYQSLCKLHLKMKFYNEVHIV